MLSQWLVSLALAIGVWAPLAAAPQLPVSLARSPSTAMQASSAASAKAGPTLAKFAEPLPSPQFRRFGIADGLPGPRVNAVAQDAEGYIWFGGSVGLSRYDGVEFQSYAHDDGNPRSLSNNEITQLLPSGDGRLWVGTADGGLDRLDPRTGEFMHWRHREGDAGSLASDSVLALAEGTDRSLWIGTARGLDRLAADGKHLEHVAFPAASQSADDGMVSALYLQDDDTLWLGTRSGRLMRRRGSAGWQVVNVPTTAGERNEIRRIDGDRGQIRISTRQGLFLVEGGGEVRPAFSHAQLPSSFYVFGSARDLRGRLWLATIHGVVMEDERSRIHRFHSKPQMLGGLPGEWVLSVLCDREGGLWFTFYDGGAAYLPPGWEGFSRYSYVPDDVASLPENPPTVVAASMDGQLWVGSHGRIDKFDPTTGKSQPLIEDLRQQVMYLVDSGDALWLTVRGELLRFDFKTRQLEQIDPDRHWITRPELLARGDDGSLFVTVARYGVLHIDPRTLNIEGVPLGEDVRNVDLRPGVLAVHDGQLWYGNHDGLLRWRLGEEKLDYVPGVLRGKPVTALTFDKEGFWLARAEELEHYRLQQGKASSLLTLKAENSWRDAVITDLDVDSANVLWIFSDNGLWSLDAQKGAVRRFGDQMALTAGRVGKGTVDVDVTPDTEPMYVPTQHGVIGFRPSQARGQAPPPAPLRFTELRAEGSRGARDLVPEHGEVVLRWFDREFHVAARILSYVEANGIRYRFRLNGYEEDWVDTGHRGERDFSGLPPATYQLEAVGVDASGNVLQTSTLWLRVESPPWRRWWAWCGYLIVLMMMIMGVAWAWQRRLADRHQIALAEERRRLAEHTSAAKTHFLATLGHEIRTPMTGVLGMAELLLNTSLDATQREYAKAMRRSGTLLLKLVNDALDLARIETGRLELEPAPFNLPDLLEDVFQLERAQADKKGLAFELQVVGVLPKRLIGDAIRIKQILLNLANNALKFTEHGKVSLRVRYAEGRLHMSVIDTGPGIAPSSQERMFERFEQGFGPQRRQGSGLGLAICRELVALMGGDISLESQLAVGSSFHVVLPLPEPDRSPARAALDAAAEASGALRLLLVEDDAIVAAVITGMLEHQGHAVCHVANGLAALVELAQADYDAVLLDLDLPGLNGFEIARMIRHREAPGVRLPIIAVTARSAADDEQNAQQAGMDGFLRKPLTGRQLQEALSAALAVGEENASVSSV